MVQNFSPFLLINKSGGNRNSFHLGSMFIKEVNAVKWRLEIFCKISCKISLSTVFTHLAQACQVAKWQDGAWSKEGYVIPGIKDHELKARLFPLPMLFVLCLFSFPFPCLHPVPKDRSRQCFCCPPDTCLGLLGLAATPPAHLSAAFQLLLGWVEGGEPHLQRLSSPRAQLGCLAGQDQEVLMCRWPCLMQSFSKGSIREPFG